MPQSAGDARKDIRVEVKFRNNLVLKRMEKKGITSLVELCERMGRPKLYSMVVGLVSMKRSARDKRNQWLPAVMHLADFFQCMPEDLFSEQQQYNTLEKNRAHAEVAYTEIQQLSARDQKVPTPELTMQASQLRKAVVKALETLTPREERVLRMRFGFETGEEMSLADIGQQFGLVSESIRRIETIALRKLKHPARKRLFSAAAGEKKIVPTDWGFSEVHTIDPDIVKAL